MQSNLNKRAKAPKASLLGPGDAIGCGDSYLVADLLPTEIADTAFEKLKAEVKWETMAHRGGEVPRLVAMEGEIAEDGSYPVYRFPSDGHPPMLPFSPTVALIREHVQKVLKHPVNHVLIQFYRNGKDAISDHSDKTIDVVRGSSIVNVSLGAQRTMTLRLKKDKADVDDPVQHQLDSTPDDAPRQSVSTFGVPRVTQRIPLPHNSMFVMSLETNAKWLHGINPDNRPLHIKSLEERAEDGARISLTFRHIATFISKDQSLIWGQGATGKTKDQAKKVVYKSEEAKKLLMEFGNENQRNDFKWDAAYGKGFDLLDLLDRNAA
ncbi:DNA oxidative demethylase ALKBH2 [Psilocybe cubensis]|uniref:DNA oxidative demethylase ALKBH2 n=2 Tax=Psilocybe cubensis TaxID=181762 RepID=A0ACB8GI57_PSICU|nr:DNA oxidative demethylase ALKBH2 [Psilocybe cubensis]KAH9475284.1 DNA oxidative demethylase ALKBH2 [Psilocybe cubensis]